MSLRRRTSPPFLLAEISFIYLFIYYAVYLLSDCYRQRWFEDINSSPKSLHYKEFKSALDIETYLNIEMTYVLRKAFSNFRCSGHKLIIEKGRHLNIERNLRFCPLCQMENLSVIEDEYHFFFEFEIYEMLRETYFENHWRVNRSLDLFHRLMASKTSNAYYQLQDLW